VPLAELRDSWWAHGRTCFFQFHAVLTTPALRVAIRAAGSAARDRARIASQTALARGAPPALLLSSRPSVWPGSARWERDGWVGCTDRTRRGPERPISHRIRRTQCPSLMLLRRARLEPVVCGHVVARSAAPLRHANARVVEEQRNSSVACALTLSCRWSGRRHCLGGQLPCDLGSSVGRAA